MLLLDTLFQIEQALSQKSKIAHLTPIFVIFLQKEDFSSRLAKENSKN